MNLTLHYSDFLALSPLLILFIGSLLVLLLESFAETASKTYSICLTCTTIIIAFIATFYSPISNNSLLTPWLQFTPISLFFTRFFLLISLGCAFLAAPFFRRFEPSRGEYFFLLLASTIGLILIGDAADFLTLFLGLETLSISLYILCGYMKIWKDSHEAAMKYFFIGAIGAAILLYGIAMIYGSLGTTRLDTLSAGYKNLVGTHNYILFITGIALITVGLAFKASIVPFHTWAPDVYAGAPTPVTAFMAVGTKVGAFAPLANIFLISLPDFNRLWNEGISLLIYPTMIYANFVALRQTQIRRFFAYSGISHAGFMLIPFAGATVEAFSALSFYLIIYSFATLGAFAVILFLDKTSQGVLISDLKGLFQRSPFLAAFLSLCLLTLAGMPPTAGFLAKFYLFKVAFSAGYYGIVVIGLLMTILSVYYYSRIIAIMFSESTNDLNEPARSWPATSICIGALIAIIAISCYPEPLMIFLQSFD